MRKPLLTVAALTAGCVLMASCAMPYDDPNYQGAQQEELIAEAGGQVTSEGGSEDVVNTTVKPPRSIGIDTPLAAEPEAGKTIVTIGSDLFLDPVEDAGIKSAADALGWTVESIDGGTTIGTQKDAFAEALAKKPDGIHVSWIDTDALADELAAAEAAGIPVVCTGCVGEPVGALKDTAIAGDKQQAAWADALGAYVGVGMDGGVGDIPTFTIGSVPVLVKFYDDFVGVLAKVCRLCQPSQNDIEIGTEPPVTPITANLVEQFLATYAVTVSGNLFEGVPEAMTGEGLEGLFEVIGNMATATNISTLADGTTNAWTGYSAPIAGWRVIDSFARIFADQPIVDALLPSQLLTQDNVADLVLTKDGDYLGIADYEAQFKKLWQVS